MWFLTHVSHAWLHMFHMRVMHVTHMWYMRATHVSQACHFTCVSHVCTVSPKYLILNQFIFQLKDMWNMCKFTRMYHMCDTHVKHACYNMSVTCVAFFVSFTCVSHACETHVLRMCHMRGIFAGVVNIRFFNCVLSPTIQVCLQNDWRENT